MIYRILFSGFVLFLIFSNIKRVIKYSALCPSNVKVFFVAWNALIIVGFFCFIGFVITLNKFFIYSFVSIFPISGLMVTIFPLQFSILQKVLQGKIWNEPVNIKLKTAMSQINPLFSELGSNSNKKVNYFSTTGFFRIVGLFFLIFGGIFLFYIISSFK